MDSQEIERIAQLVAEKLQQRQDTYRVEPVQPYILDAFADYDYLSSRAVEAADEPKTRRGRNTAAVLFGASKGRYQITSASMLLGDSIKNNGKARRAYKASKQAGQARQRLIDTIIYSDQGDHPTVQQMLRERNIWI